MHKWKRWFWGNGHADRKEYWTVLLLATLASTTIHFALATLVLSLPSAVYPATAALLLLTITCAWLVICAASRRLHDLGRSAWWQLAAIAAGFIGSAVLEPAWAPRLGLDQDTAALVAFLFSAAMTLFYLVIGVLKAKDRPIDTPAA